MPSLTLSVTSGNDDARDALNQLNFQLSQSTIIIERNTSTGTADCGAFVWQDVTVPQGATINSATVEFYCDSTAVDDPEFTMYGNDVDDAQNFVEAASMPMTITLYSI